MSLPVDVNPESASSSVVTLAVMQPYFLPYVGYFQLVRAVDKFVIYDDVSYIKQGWVNRNTLLYNGEQLLFTLPLSNGKSGVPIKEVALAPNFPAWKRRFLKTVRAAYQKAPNYSQIAAMLDNWLTEHDGMLVSILRNSLIDICDWLGLKAQIIPTSSAYNNSCLDRESRLIDICRYEGAGKYVNPEGGRALYERDSFAADGVELQFLRPRLDPYPQLSQKFVANVSILDFLMNVSRENSLACLGAGELL